MKFQSKKHATLALKKKSGDTLSADEQKELDALNTKSEEDKKKEDEEKKTADEAAAKAKADEDKKKEDEEKAKAEAAKKEEEDKKKPAPEKKEGEEGTESSVTLESLSAAISKLSENMNMLMEAFATMMDTGAPAEEAKGDEGTEDKPKEEETEEESEQTDEEMEEELEKTIAELESIENA